MIKRRQKQGFKKLDISCLISEMYHYNPLWALIMSWFNLNFRGKENPCVLKSHGRLTVVRFIKYDVIFIPD